MRNGSKSDLHLLSRSQLTDTRQCKYKIATYCEGFQIYRTDTTHIVKVWKKQCRAVPRDISWCWRNLTVQQPHHRVRYPNRDQYHIFVLWHPMIDFSKYWSQYGRNPNMRLSCHFVHFRFFYKIFKRYTDSIKQFDSCTIFYLACFQTQARHQDINSNTTLKILAQANIR